MRTGKRSKSGPVHKAEMLTTKDKLKIFGGLAVALVLPALMFHVSCIQGQKSSIARTVERWRLAYGIDEDQASRIRQIEFDYHGTGSPFSIRRNRSREERDAHYLAIANHMPSDGSTRFLEEMKKGCDN